MALTISHILPRSTASKYSLKAGDEIIGINGHEIRDFLDLQFYTNDLILEVQLRDQSGMIREISIQRENAKALGIEPVPYECRSCRNKCVFCFIDQMPPKLRESLYLKDDDFVYSFVFGNYITLTNLSEADFARILEQHISPIYVSVHATSNRLRKDIMGYRRNFDIMASLRRLSDAGISMHVQIVCVPLWNDGEELDNTLTELVNSGLDIISIGIVPVGLTKYRRNLPLLQPYNKRLALETIRKIDEHREQCDLIYAADEFFVLAGLPVPPLEYYRDFPQTENGIGMLRLLLDGFQSRKRSFLKELRKRERNYLFITSKSAHGSISSIATYLNRKLENQSVRVQTVKNRFFGARITVAGLLTFKDIKNQVRPEPGEIVILPASIFNYEGKTLDGAGYEDFHRIFGNDILCVDQFFEDWDWI
ncbi:MAG TPA: DUF512 domain-containing protein [Candidatus Cloacimonadota bacterium]|nr:DUF512 domain-containing protein [Candidatus Cloacimonadota bacterium]HPS38898.1 DUF512 domain-containing protein [Candidatus Cloacimonadota bacterium]